jgi:hypothetical protein
MRGAKVGGIFTEVDANTFKSGCEFGSTSRTHNLAIKIVALRDLNHTPTPFGESGRNGQVATASCSVVFWLLPEKSQRFALS